MSWKQAGLYAQKFNILGEKLLTEANSKRNELKKKPTVSMSLKVTMALNWYSPNKGLKADFNPGSSEIAKGRCTDAESFMPCSETLQGCLLPWEMSVLSPQRISSPLTYKTWACTGRNRCTNSIFIDYFPYFNIQNQSNYFLNCQRGHFWSDQRNCIILSSQKRLEPVGNTEHTATVSVCKLTTLDANSCVHTSL